jgi:salicylate hydroxylase
LGNRFLDWKGNLLLDVTFEGDEEKYGAPYYFLHRADLVRLLLDTAKERPLIHVRMGCKVVNYDFDDPSVLLASGEGVTGDLIVCCDGIKSAARERISTENCSPVDTGDVAYRIIVDSKPLLVDPQTRELVTQPWARHWIGPSCHAVGYPLRNGEIYNVIIDVTHATDLGEPIGQDEWKAGADNAALIQRFQEWCPPVRKLCSLTGQYLKWRLADFDQLQSWVHPSAKAVLLGDACHPMMPYMAQGAAQATEDAAALAAALDQCSTLREALKTYQTQRLPRTAYIARNTRVLQQWWHLHDGPVRDQRDRMMKCYNEQNPMFWGCSTRKDWLFGHDARVIQPEGVGLATPSLPPWPEEGANVYLNGTT